MQQLRKSGAKIDDGNIRIDGTREMTCAISRCSACVSACVSPFTVLRVLSRSDLFGCHRARGMATVELKRRKCIERSNARACTLGTSCSSRVAHHRFSVPAGNGNVLRGYNGNQLTGKLPRTCHCDYVASQTNGCA